MNKRMATKKKKPAKMGAPTKYKTEYCQGIIDFFMESLNGDKLEFPQLSAYARKIGVRTETLWDWQKKESPRYKSDFSKAYVECKHLQEEILRKGGLEGKFNSTFAWNTGKNVCGWRDVTEVKQDIKTEHNISPALADMFNKIYKGELK